MLAAFETLHKSKAHAFVDGLLCGAVITVMVTTLVKDYRESQPTRGGSYDNESTIHSTTV